jgi:hypothetical protein
VCGSTLQDAFLTDPASIIVAGAISTLFGDYISEQLAALSEYCMGSSE